MIPPSPEVIVMTEADKSLEDSINIIKRREEFILISDGLLVGLTVVGKTNTIPFLVANLTKEPKAIEEGDQYITVSQSIK